MLSTPMRGTSVFYEMYVQSMQTGFSMSKVTDDGEVAVIHENIWRDINLIIDFKYTVSDTTEIIDIVKDCCKPGVKFDKHLL